MIHGEHTVRVRYAETDQMGIAHHSNFFIWFEIGRIELLRQSGFHYHEMEAEDCHLPVVDVRCRYKAPARYDDELRIQTEVKSIRGPVLHFVYKVLRAGDGLLLAEGESVHIVTDSKMQKKVLPEKYLAGFQGK